jgi:hypothetical protein
VYRSATLEIAAPLPADSESTDGLPLLAQGAHVLLQPMTASSQLFWRTNADAITHNTQTHTHRAVVYSVTICPFFWRHLEILHDAG